MVSCPPKHSAISILGFQREDNKGKKCLKRAFKGVKKKEEKG